MTGRLKLLLMLLILPTLLRGEPADTVAKAPEPAYRISVLTCYPGSEIYELEGHSGLRISNDSIDMTVNWGLFNFAAPNFVYRFVKGETDYSVGAEPTHYFLYRYMADGRRVVEQVLDLTPEESNKVVELVNRNLQPANRIYRYNYVKDNCATRVYRIIEQATDDSIAFAPAPEAVTGTNPTIRNAMRSYHTNYPWYQFGIDLALGSGIDRHASNRDQGFAPASLEKMLDGATVGERQLVSSTNILVEGSPEGGPLEATPWYLTPLFWCWAVAVIVIALSVRDLRRRRLSRWLDTILYTLFGLDGLVLTFLIFVSVHEATSPNWLYLWLNPLCLLAAAGIWIKKLNKAVFYWQIVNFVALITLTILAAVGVQSLNAAFYPLIICDLARSLTYIKLYRCHAITIAR